MNADPADYTWIEDAGAGEGLCLTLVTGATPGEVLAAMGADPAQPVHLDDDTEPEYLVSVVEVPGGVVALELNGYIGSLPEVVQRASLRGRCASVFWNVEHDNRFTCAEGGRLVAEVDMYDAEEPGDVDLPDDLRPTYEDLGAFIASDDGVPGHPGIWATALAMAVHFTGVHPTSASIEGLTTAYRLPQ